MGHITSKNFLQLQARLDKSPQGAPKSETLFKILEHLFTEKEAGLVSKLPIKPFKLEKAASIWKLSYEETEKILEGLADKGLIVDLTNKKEKIYALAPTMAGFFEWSIMKMGGSVNKKLLSELYYQYLNKEDDFVKRVFALNPAIYRTYVQEETIEEKDKDIIMDYESAIKAIEKADYWALGLCYCRHKMEHLGKNCKHAQEDVCMAFNEVARSMVKHGVYKEATKERALEILKQCKEEGLVQIGSNMQEGISWMCNCCGCCCEALLSYKRLGYNPRIETNWLAKNNVKKCTGCGICVKKCPVNAIKIVKKENEKVSAEIDKERCIGCGVCKGFCPARSLKMERRKETVFVPKDTFERHIMQAIDSGTLQNLIFDNYHLWQYGVLRAFLGIIFKLQPAKWILANRQLQSRFIQAVGNYYYKKNPELFDKKPDYSHPELKKKF